MAKAHIPYVVIHLDQTPIFEHYVARFLSKNGYQNDMGYNEIGSCA